MEIKSSPIYGSMLGTNPISKGGGYVVLPGKYQGSPASLRLDETVLSKHLLLIGGTGCGKTNVFNFLIRDIQSRMTERDVMLIFDTKGDYYSTFGRASDVLIANSPGLRDRTAQWNIFRELLADGWTDDALETNAQELSWAIFREAIDKSKDPFFPNAARDLFAAVLLCMLKAGRDDEDYRHQNFYNCELKRAFEESTISEIGDMLLDEPSVASVTSYIGDGENTQALGVYAEMLSVFRRLFVGAFAAKGSFSMRDFIRKKGGRTLYIEYDLAVGNLLSPIYSLLFDLALKEALGRGRSEGNIYLICDEFRLLPYLQHIDDGVNFGRSMGVKVIAGLQSINQLTEVYKQARGANIAAGFSTVMAFRANDRDTREYVSGLFGRNYIKEEYRTLANSVREERRSANVVEDWDMNGLEVGQAVVGLPFAQPFRFQFDLFSK